MAQDEVELQIQRAAWALVTMHAQSRKGRSVVSDAGTDAIHQAEGIDTIRACFVVRGALSQDEFRHRVVDAAQRLTLTIEEGGIETMADWHELEDLLLKTLRQGLQ